MYDNSRLITRTVYANCTFTVKLAMTTPEGNFITRSDVAAIWYSVYENGTFVNEWEPVEEDIKIPLSAILNTPEGEEDNKYNFVYNFPGDMFPDRNTTRRLAIRFELKSGFVVAPPEILCIAR